MGAGSSTNTSNNINTSSARNVRAGSDKNIAPKRAVSDDASSFVAVNATIGTVEESRGGRTYRLVGKETNGESTEGILTLWKPTVSDDLIREDGNEGDVYVREVVNLEPRRKKKRGCRCLCCFCKRRRRRSRGSSNMDGNDDGEASTYTEAYDDDENGMEEIISLQSAGEVIIIPSEVFPLEMVAVMDTKPSEVVKNKPSRPRKPRRSRVPEKPDKPLGLWGLIKSAIGKDITRLPLPVNFAEPLSMLQRLAEDYEYSAILDKASQMSDSLEQLASVAAFTVSSYASTAVRSAKPFNPMLGETYECDRTDDLGWRCIAEQVCHHPPIAALHCESARGWVHWQQFTMKSNFKGTFLEIHPLGVAHLRFKTSENHYTWHKVSTIVRNLYIGKIYIEQEGEMNVINHTTNEVCHMKYSCGGMFSKDRAVTGKVFNSKGEAKWEINGTWDKEIRATKLDSGGKAIENGMRVLWKNNPLPPEAEIRYYFSYFACQLNDIEEGVAPTDSRNRPDQRFMENGQWDEANVEKQRLEDKQRDTRKQRLSDGNQKVSTISNLNTKPIKTSSIKNIPISGPEDGVEPFYTPCWFARQRDPISGQCMYIFNGEYWNCKVAKDWSRCPSLFDK